MAADNDDIRALAVAFTTAVATAGRLAEELDRTVNDLNDFMRRREELRDLRERRHPDALPPEGGDRRG